jgi:hypothetical protein
VNNTAHGNGGGPTLNHVIEDQHLHDEDHCDTDELRPSKRRHRHDEPCEVGMSSLARMKACTLVLIARFIDIDVSGSGVPRS